MEGLRRAYDAYRSLLWSFSTTDQNCELQLRLPELERLAGVAIAGVFQPAIWSLRMLSNGSSRKRLSLKSEPAIMLSHRVGARRVRISGLRWCGVQSGASCGIPVFRVRVRRSGRIDQK